LKQIAPIFHFIKQRPAAVLRFTIFNLLSVIFGMASLALLIPFLNLLFEKEELVRSNPGFELSLSGISNYFKYLLSEIVVSHQNDKLWALGLISFLVLVATILKNTFLYWARYTLHPLRNEISRKVKSELYDKILHLPIGFFTNERKGDILSRITNDVKEIEDSISSTMDLLFSVPFTILFYLVFMLAVSAKLCLFLFLLLPIGGFVIGRVSKKLKSQSTDNSLRLGSLLSIVEETLGGLRVIKAFGAEKLQQIKFATENNYLNRLNNKIAARRELASPLSETMAIVILCFILLYGGKLVLVDKEITGSTFIMFILVFTQLIDPLKKFSQIFYNIQKGNASLERINAIAKANNTLQDAPNAKSINSFEHSIELKNVHFSYADKVVIENVSLTIPKGSTIALVGASGSGKSTLVDLIPRFHDVQQGAVLIDGVNVKDYKIRDLRQLMGIVSQEPILFNDTIANNIALSGDTNNAAKIEEAAKVANALSFIQHKEAGFAENIGDRGNQLSGGEKQRLTIARAVFKNPSILILDEATSSLDTESERLVQDSINKLVQNRTCIVIAHRLSTVQNADCIVVMNQGKIVEQGSHQALIAQNGFYKKLVDMQTLA
jgi:ATP-binding cassette, subfamily B, bacterial MsbA